MSYDQANSLKTSTPRPQTEIERLNERLNDAIGSVNRLRSRVYDIANYTIGHSPTEPGAVPGNEIGPVSSNTQHFIVDLEKALERLGTEISRLDNQGS
jgi:hypothetical protein